MRAANNCVQALRRLRLHRRVPRREVPARRAGYDAVRGHLADPEADHRAGPHGDHRLLSRGRPPRDPRRAVQDLAQFSMMRSFRRDPSVQDKKLAPGTVRRIARFAAPYKRDLAVVPRRSSSSTAFVAVAQPADLQEDHRRRHRHEPAGDRRPRPGDRRWRCSSPGWRCSTRSCRCGQRWYSARIGEGLIYDLRTQVYAHVQRMPIAFFTRTQTGALISRLNNDVLGAQQAFTGTLSRRRQQRHRRRADAHRDARPVVADHAAVAGAAAGVRHPGQAHRHASCRS